jgi:phosphoglycolate phosphatase
MERLWLLDFDGTLVHSEKAIKACYLKVGQELVPERYNFIETMIIGPTLDESSRMILTDKNQHLIDVFKKKFQKLYDDNLVFETPQYPHVDETLKQLHDQGDHLCIVTNKRAHPTYKLIDHFAWRHLFEWVACMDEYPAAQNKSDLIKLKNIDKNQFDAIYLIGDTLNDGKAAQINDIPFIRADYGYGKDQDWSEVKIFKAIEQFNEVLNL